MPVDGLRSPCRIGFPLLVLSNFRVPLAECEFSDRCELDRGVRPVEPFRVPPGLLLRDLDWDFVLPLPYGVPPGDLLPLPPPPVLPGAGSERPLVGVA